MKLTRNTRRLLLTLAPVCLITLPLMACAPKSLAVHPARPASPLKVKLPAAVTQPVPKPAWLQ